MGSVVVSETGNCWSTASQLLDASSLFGPDSINGPAPLETMGHSRIARLVVAIFPEGGGMCGRVVKSPLPNRLSLIIGTKYICIKAISSTANLASGLFHTHPLGKVATTSCVVLMRFYGESIIATAVTLVCSCIPVPLLTPASQVTGWIGSERKEAARKAVRIATI